MWQPAGITVLGTPIGSEQYISEKMEERITKERALWEAIPTVPDLQCAWQLGQGDPVEGCLGELQAAATELDWKGFWWRPAWAELHAGRRPPPSLLTCSGFCCWSACNFHCP